MKIAFTINDVLTEHPGYTTTHLAMHALKRGHEVWYIEVGSFVLSHEDGLNALARCLPQCEFDNRDALIACLRETQPKTRKLDELDVLFLRNDPAADALARPWAQLAGVNFGRLAQQAGVLVVNRPDGLYHAINKLYLQLFPAEIRPRTLITRDFEAVQDFLDTVGGKAVVKPLRGSGGHNVFLISKEDRYNFKQIFDAVCREGYLIAQEFLPEATEGDTRLFILNGEIIESGGEIAAVQRVPHGGDLRSNLSAGGHARRAEITPTVRRIAALARPQLMADGMFFVGLDLIGDRMVEVNVFSPGALIAAERLTGADFGSAIVAALERMVSLPAAGFEACIEKDTSTP